MVLLQSLTGAPLVKITLKLAAESAVPNSVPVMTTVVPPDVGNCAGLKDTILGLS